MESCKKLIASCFVGRGRSTIAVVLVMLIAIRACRASAGEWRRLGHCGSGGGRGGRRQLDHQHDRRALLGTANGLLGSINGFFQALVNLWENVVYPINLINQARMRWSPAHRAVPRIGRGHRQRERPQRDSCRIHLRWK